MRSHHNVAQPVFQEHPLASLHRNSFVESSGVFLACESAQRKCECENANSSDHESVTPEGFVVFPGKGRPIPSAAAR
jgi:hypothetical protein